MTDDRPIGVFDSGAGGISVLRQLMRHMPHERFAYFGDSRHTPYGDKPVGWIRGRSEQVVGLLVDTLGCKAVVIACNTATAAAADHLRQVRTDVPIFGIEPALKPAATENPGGTVLVMATEATLHLDRFRLLVDRWGTGATVVPVPCSGLADAIEDGIAGTPMMDEMVRGFVGDWSGRADAVVLGCTHYPFVEDEIRRVLGEGIAIYDGADGTARNVQATLMAQGMLAGDSRWRDEDRPSEMLLGTGPESSEEEGRHEEEGSIVPSVWSVPDDRVLMMTSGTIAHIMRFEALAFPHAPEPPRPVEDAPVPTLADMLA